MSGLRQKLVGSWKRGHQSTGAAAPRTPPRKSWGRRISVHPAGEGAHEYARVGDSKTCTFCTKLKKCERA